MAGDNKLNVRAGTDRWENQFVRRTLLCRKLRASPITYKIYTVPVGDTRFETKKLTLDGSWRTVAGDTRNPEPAAPNRVAVASAESIFIVFRFSVA